MTRKVLDEEQIAIMFFEDGTVTTARGIVDTSHFNGVKQAFIVKADMPLYKVSDYFGYGQIDKSWIELK